MSFDTRIARMRDQGMISEDQAQRLSQAIGDVPRGGAAAEAPRRGPAGPVWLYALLGALALAGLWLLFASPDVARAPEAVQDVREALNQPEEVGGMNKSFQGTLSLFLFVVVPLLLVVVWIAWLYNALVTKEEGVFQAWAQVESNYQRRADLIPNVLEAVADYMQFERETLGEIVAQRSGTQAALPEGLAEELRATIDAITGAQEDSADVLDGISGAPVDDAALARLAEAQAALGASLGRILALSENYPQLRSSDQVLALQAELEGTENRINIARIRFNEAASDFNAAIRRMPASVIASAGGFRRKAYFASDPGADKPVAVSLD